jgi:hypothetical protein
VIRAAILLGILTAVVVGCGSSSESVRQRTTSQEEQDRRDSAAIQREVNKEVDERARIAATEAETASESETTGSVVDSETVCTKQSATAYKCLTTFTDPPGAPNAVTDVTCDRNGASCITETK